MRVRNYLPLLLECLTDWRERPTQREFIERYFLPCSESIGIVFDHDGAAFYSVLDDLDWQAYRADALCLDPAREEARFRRHLGAVEELFGIRLPGEAILFGAFTCMDGYARFDRGLHQVYLGVDESHGRGAYLDILIAHELTHVVRETQPEAWAGFGLFPDLTQVTHDEFVENLPVIEHVFSEGFSCAVSELLVPSDEPWHYAYQSRDSLAQVLKHGPAVDRVLHHEISAPSGDYGRLYQTSLYGRGIPQYAHYVWGWLWVKELLRTHAQGSPRDLASRCSKDFLADALSFKLRQS